MPTNCVITFDHSNGIYSSGDTVKGHIKLITTKTKSIRAIYIKVKGYADVKWEERRSRTSNGKTEYYSVYYTAHEQYLNSVTYVLGRDCGDSFNLLSGIYEYTFNCALPIDLPTSCHEHYGKIRYEVSVTIDRPFRFDNVFSKEFKVNRSLDLNLTLAKKLPTSHNGTTEICCLCCCCGSSGRVRGELKVQFTGAIPGQSIPFQLFVDNDSNVDIESSKVKFKKVITFESTSPSRQYKYISADLDTKLFQPVLRLSRKEFKNSVQIPTGVQCSQLGGCIRIQYYIKGKVYMGCCTSNIEIEIPITIGSIPFREEPRDFNNIPIITTQPTAPPPSILTESNNLPPVYKSLDLPTYEDAIQLIEHSDDESLKKKKNVKQLPTTNHNSELPTAPPNDYNDSVITNTPTGPIAASTSSGSTSYGWS